MIDLDQLSTVTGGEGKDPTPSPETIGCAIGGGVGVALGTPLTPVGQAAAGAVGCMIGGAAANVVSQPRPLAKPPRGYHPVH